MRKNQIVIVSLAILGQSQAFSGGLTFEEAFQSAVAHSPEILAQGHEARAAELSLKRARSHWFPDVGLKASAYTTNDSGGSFFGALSQRSVRISDFSPIGLNDPGYQGFQNISLVVDLPLYEGGRKAESLKALALAFEASELVLKLKKRELIGAILKHYGSLVSEKSARSKLLHLKDQVQKILNRYSIGNAANPVGYSGILGLRGLNNRIDAEMIAIETSEKSEKIALTEKTGIEFENAVLLERNVKEIVGVPFAELNSPLDLAGRDISEALASKREDALVFAKNAERSRYLPRIGLFGNESMTHGARDTGYTTTAGIYLAWSLFSPDNLYRVSELEEREGAAGKEKALAIRNSRIARGTVNEAELALERTIKILDESDQILDEQVKVASRLFQSGSISALQLAEVYNRRADLILNLRQAERNWVDLKSSKAVLLNSNGAML